MGHPGGGRILERFIKGDVVVLPYPFSDFTTFKRRPAVVILELDGDDVILAQITSNLHFTKYSIPITQNNFADGGLNKPSSILLNKVCTIDSKLIEYKAGKLSQDTISEINSKIIEFFS
jgi:mRNA interferase MazF